MDARRILRRLAPICAVALVLGSGAAPLSAADDVSETRALSGFDRVRLRGAFAVKISAGAAATHVAITASRDLIDRVTTSVEDRTLVVGMKPETHAFNAAPKVSIALPALHGFANEGAGSAKIIGLTGGEITIENAGAASIVAAGRADRVAITLAGAGTIDTTGIDARDVTVDNDGVGSVKVRASGQLTMNVNGIGEIRYAGKPAHIASQVNGIGHIGPL